VRGINDFKKGYQPRTIIVKDEKGDMIADSQSIMARWRNYFSQLLNVHGVNDVRQAEIHFYTAPILLPACYVTNFKADVHYKRGVIRGCVLCASLFAGISRAAERTF
jgi:hypothetical protein